MNMIWELENNKLGFDRSSAKSLICHHIGSGAKIRFTEKSRKFNQPSAYAVCFKLILMCINFEENTPIRWYMIGRQMQGPL